MADFSDNENSLGSSPNTKPEQPTNADDAHKEADKPVEPNTDVEGGNGPVKTT